MMVGRTGLGPPKNTPAGRVGAAGRIALPFIRANKMKIAWKSMPAIEQKNPPSTKPGGWGKPESIVFLISSGGAEAGWLLGHT